MASNKGTPNVKNREVKRLEREMRLARSECSRLGAIIMELRIERDTARREARELKQSLRDLAADTHEWARNKAAS